MSTCDCGVCNLLAKYARGEEEIRIVYESDMVLAVHSTKPFAEVHVFIASKRHVPTIFDMTESDYALALDMMRAVRAASREVIALKGACRLEMYLGAFQNTKHLHCHVVYDATID